MKLSIAVACCGSFIEMSLELNSANPCSDSLNNSAMEHRDSEVSTADIVYGGVGTAYMSLCDLYCPQNLNQPEHCNSFNDLANHPHNHLLLGHVPLYVGLKVVVGTSSCVAPVEGPPPGG